jgi:integrase/recombinase XerD
VLRFRTKGKTQVLPLEPGTAAALDCYLSARDARGPADPDAVCRTCRAPVADHLFLTTPWRNHGGGRALTAQEMGELLRRHAFNAGIVGAAKLVPHSLRHAAITAALDEGVPLTRVQDMAGHADPRTTRRYDHNRGKLDQSAVYDLARRWNRYRQHPDDQPDDTTDTGS